MIVESVIFVSGVFLLFLGTIWKHDNAFNVILKLSCLLLAFGNAIAFMTIMFPGLK